MSHSDDNGLVLPPHLAPIQCVIVPISKNSEQLAEITKVVEPIVKELRALGVSVKYDDADNKRPASSLPTMNSRVCLCASQSVHATLKTAQWRLCAATLSRSR